MSSFDAYGARDAVRWIRIAVPMLVSALDEEEAEPVHEWLLLRGRRAIDTLQSGEAFTIALRHGRLRLAWSARPVQYLPLTHRVGSPLPPCAQNGPSLRHCERPWR
ncbi:hypothetical protein [Streptomyces sp. 7N604]|uniref:hypothetical protein n=1 Tax=Streptomyces sp. 7N604 TaxID=3457415 RepID=UPI003FD46519